MPIVIKPLLPEQGEEALLFLQPYESECVNLASEILRGATDCWALYYAEPSQASGSIALQTETREKSARYSFACPLPNTKAPLTKKFAARRSVP